MPKNSPSAPEQPATPAAPRRRTILVADDHAVVRDGLCVILGLYPEFEIVGEAADGEEALRKCLELRPDLLLLDLRMPIMDGVDVVRQVRLQIPEQLILIITTYDTDEDIYNCMKAGARGYILKDSPRDVIIEAATEILAGHGYTPARIADKLLSRMASPELTAREQEVLRHIASGLGNKAIAEAMSLSEATIKTHAKNIHAKLGVSSRTEAVSIARQRGYLKG